MGNKLIKKFKIPFSIIRQKARKIKNEVGALYFACKHPDVPFYAKLVAIITVGYALSPIDLIPDFIPILGYLDDLVLVPLGITLAIKLIPIDIMNECRNQAANNFTKGKNKNWFAGGIIICIWIIIICYVLIKVSTIYL
ncbi:YkvA family protein [Clostridium sp. YIM B02555]|uniref:YkvA family protein n=1 Tax=Clostridium sp. YIM B02555 TaxID=2911968 RepID=UPI001EEE0BA4|nr:YkvA family protein [Clostridium sp. YIM B02555]